MVKVAIAGGTGNVASCMLEGILASKKHEVTILSRRSTASGLPEGVKLLQVDYNDKPSLVEKLRGIDVVMSFLVVHLDESNMVQRNLIDASIEAGVKRFAPSEWGVRNGSGIPHYKNKDETRKYLEEINKNKKVIEYCLFQPSIFMDYFAHPYTLTPQLITWPFLIDYENRRAYIVGNGEQPMVLTAMRDDVRVVTAALSYEGEWPTVGGIRGSRTNTKELIALGEKLRGGKFDVQLLTEEDIENGVWKGTWVPKLDHPTVLREIQEEFSLDFVLTFTNGILHGAWDVSDEWNRLLPDMKFSSVEEYLTEAWKGKP